MRLIMFWLFPCVATAACLPVEGNKILAHDLARAVPEFGAVAQDTFLAFAPVPGAKRYFAAADIRRIADKFGIRALSATDLCFEYPTRVLTTADVVGAMASALIVENAHIEVVEVSRYPVPPGIIRFPISMLAKSGDIRLWRGILTYGAGRHVPIWCRVRIWVESECVVAARDIRAGEKIREEDVRLSVARIVPVAPLPERLADAIVGQIAKERIRQGAPILPDQIQRTNEVTKGAIVQVSAALDGLALNFPAVAESTAGFGQTIQLRNPTSGRTFRGNVTGRNSVKVDLN